MKQALLGNLNLTKIEKYYHSSEGFTVLCFGVYPAMLARQEISAVCSSDVTTKRQALCDAAHSGSNHDHIDRSLSKLTDSLMSMQISTCCCDRTTDVHLAIWHRLASSVRSFLNSLVHRSLHASLLHASSLSHVACDR